MSTHKGMQIIFFSQHVKCFWKEKKIQNSRNLEWKETYDKVSRIIRPNKLLTSFKIVCLIIARLCPSCQASPSNLAPSKKKYLYVFLQQSEAANGSFIYSCVRWNWHRGNPRYLRAKHPERSICSHLLLSLFTSEFHRADPRPVKRGQSQERKKKKKK